MKRKLATLIISLATVAAIQAATTNTTLTINANGVVGATGIAVTGTATLTGIGSGTITSTIPLSALGATTANVDFTIALSGGNLTGTVSVPSLALLGQAPLTGSATITGGTGTYAGVTGSFPSLTGTIGGSLTAPTIMITGNGTITTGGTPPPTAPTVTAVLDAASNTPGIAQGSIFIVKGSNMSASGFNQFGFPLPTTSNNVKITFTPAGGGSGTDAYLVYLYNQSGVNQLAAILPSSVTPGSYNVTVTNNGTPSPAFTATVVQRKVALFTQDSTGNGAAVVQSYISATEADLNRLTTSTINGVKVSPAKPGQVMIAWATGLGPVTTGDNVASPGFDFNANGVPVTVIVGGVSAQASYAGRVPSLAGEDQINFTLPSNVPTGCAIPIQISVGGTLSPSTTIAIAPAGSDVCVQPGLTPSQLQTLDNGGSFAGGGFALEQIQETLPTIGTVKVDEVAGGFVRITGFQLAAAASTGALAGPTPTNSCQVISATSSTNSSNPGGQAAITINGLDAGAITFNGPTGSGITSLKLTEDPTYLTYGLSLGEEGITLPGVPNVTLLPGAYTLTGAGGKDVGAFTASITLGGALTITGGLPATITRSAGMTLNWTGGNASDFVEIVGGTSSSTKSGTVTTTTTTEFICTTSAGQKTFTVGPDILNQLQPATTGFLEVLSTVAPTTFTAPLTAGGSINGGVFYALTGSGGAPAYQ